MWNRKDDRECVDAEEANGKRSLFCALQKACIDVNRGADTIIAGSRYRKCVSLFRRCHAGSEFRPSSQRLQQPAHHAAVPTSSILLVATDRVRARLKKK